MTHDERRWRQRSPLMRACLLVAAAALVIAGNALALYVFGSETGTLLAFTNTLVTPNWVTKEGMFRLKNTLRFAIHGMTRTYDPQFKARGVKMGNIINARLPVEVTVKDGAEFQGQDLEERTVPIEMTDQMQVGIEFGSWALTMQVEDYRERYLEPIFDRLAAETDKRAMERMAKATSEFVGVPGVPPGSTGTLPYASTDAYLDAGVILDDALVPDEDRKAFMPPKLHRYLVGGQQAVFNPAQQISQNYRKGMFGGSALGVEEWYKTQSTYRHTIGALGGTPLVDGAGQSGTSILLSGWTSAVAVRLKAGDKITFASSYAVNRLTKATMDHLKCFTVTEDCSSTSGGAMTVKIFPAIEASGPYQNVSALPAHGDAVKTFGHASTYQNVITTMGIINNKNAYALVSADLEKMEGASVCERIRNKSVGLAFRIWKDRDIRSDSQPCRVDVAFGVKAVREHLGIVVVG